MNYGKKSTRHIMSCTLVTAFYPIRSKFLPQQYLEWGKNFLSLQSPIVLFTEEHLVETFRSIRPSHLSLYIVVLPFNQLDTWSGTLPEQWNHQHTLNPEGHIIGHMGQQQTPELYAIWSQKPYFVEKAIHLNPFQTDFFFWCDFGAFREAIPEAIQEKFPETKHFVPNRLLVQAMTSVPPHEKERQSDGIFGPRLDHSWNHVRFIGGLWGGDKQACLAWKEAYHRMLHLYFEKGRYAGNDQIVMLSTILENPSLTIAVNPTREDINQWFFLEYLLSSLADLKVDMSYC